MQIHWSERKQKLVLIFTQFITNQICKPPWVWTNQSWLLNRAPYVWILSRPSRQRPIGDQEVFHIFFKERKGLDLLENQFFNKIIKSFWVVLRFYLHVFKIKRKNCKGEAWIFNFLVQEHRIIKIFNVILITFWYFVVNLRNLKLDYIAERENKCVTYCQCFLHFRKAQYCTV